MIVEYAQCVISSVYYLQLAVNVIIIGMPAFFLPLLDPILEFLV